MRPEVRLPLDQRILCNCQKQSSFVKQLYVTDEQPVTNAYQKPIYLKFFCKSKDSVFVEKLWFSGL